MSAIQFHPNEIFIVYNPSTYASKQTKAIAMSICNHINEMDATNNKLTTTLWKEIVSMLKVDPSELLDKSSAEYQLKVGDDSYTMTGWLDVLSNNPQLLTVPIAIFNGQAILVRKPTDMLKLENASKASNRVPPHLREDA
jgi:arsenate reductase (glutaredoxin)